MRERYRLKLSDSPDRHASDIVSTVIAGGSG